MHTRGVTPLCVVAALPPGVIIIFQEFNSLESVISYLKFCFVEIPLLHMIPLKKRQKRFSSKLCNKICVYVLFFVEATFIS